MSKIPPKTVLLRALLLAFAPGLLFPGQALAAAKCKPSDVTQHEAAQLAMLAAQPLAPHIILFSEPETQADSTGEEMDPGAVASLTFRVFDPRANPGVANTIGYFSVDKRTLALSDPIANKPVALTPAVKARQAQLRKVHCLN